MISIFIFLVFQSHFISTVISKVDKRSDGPYYSIFRESTRYSIIASLIIIIKLRSGVTTRTEITAFCRKSGIHFVRTHKQNFDIVLLVGLSWTTGPPGAMRSAEGFLYHWLQLTNDKVICARSETPNKLCYLFLTFQSSLISVPAIKVTSSIVMFQTIVFSHFCTAICTSRCPLQ